MRKLLFIGFTSFMIFSSCKKDKDNKRETASVENFKELKVPGNFTFNTYQSVNVNVSVENPGFDMPFQIKIYDYFPTAGGSMIYSGYTREGQLSADIIVSQAVKKLYLVKADPDGASSMVAVNVNGKSVDYIFTKGKKGKKTLVVSPDCNSGCTQTINGMNGYLNINSGGVYCITGDITGGINVNNGNATIRICGNITVNGNISINGSSNLEVTEGSVLNTPAINMNGQGTDITVYIGAVLNITSQNLTSNGKVVNHGEINLSNNLYSQNSFVNNGELNVLSTGESTINSPSHTPFENNGKAVFNGDLTENGNGYIENNCFLWVKDKMIINRIIQNYSYVQVDGNLGVNSNAVVTMYDGAMFYVKGGTDWPMNGDFIGSGSTSLLRFDGNVSSNSNASVEGNLELCVGGATNLASGTVSAPAVEACNQVYIPVSSCNSEGNGTPSVTDSDEDGIADENDLFPHDPGKAGESYYPGSNTFGTLAFEDLWPAQGDYDFNDVVIDYRYRAITDADGNVVEVEIDYALRAIGGSLKNGFGVQFDQLSSADVQSVSRTGNFVSNNLSANGTESGQSNAVVIFFENAFDVLPNLGTPTVNTNPASSSSEVDTNSITITLNSPRSLSAVFDLNPFIYIGEDRGKEVHLSGYEPTDRVEPAYFGMGDDDSNPSQGRYYVNQNNLPWALNIAQHWNYPVEKQDIVRAYLKFADWSQSGGSSYTDWYLQAAYIESDKIY